VAGFFQASKARAYPNILYLPEKVGVVKHSSLFYLTISEEEEKKFNSIKVRAKFSKLFTFVIYECS
jgi:hypothetical protein